jgi:mucin-2
MDGGATREALVFLGQWRHRRRRRRCKLTLHLLLPSGLNPNPVCTSLLPHSCHMSHPSHLPLFDHPQHLASSTNHTASDCTVYCSLVTSDCTVYCSLVTSDCTVYCSLVTSDCTVYCSLVTSDCTVYCSLVTPDCTVY